jgi:hypothetical protein
MKQMASSIVESVMLCAEAWCFRPFDDGPESPVETVFTCPVERGMRQYLQNVEACAHHAIRRAMRVSQREHQIHVLSDA